MCVCIYIHSYASLCTDARVCAQSCVSCSVCAVCVWGDPLVFSGTKRVHSLVLSVLLLGFFFEIVERRAASTFRRETKNKCGLMTL